MKIYCNENMEIKSVDNSTDTSLTGYELTTNNPFSNWSKGQVCCYKVNLIPETQTVVIGTKEETYIDLEGNEQTRIIDVTENQTTGKYLVTMMTPYIDTRILPIISEIGNKLVSNEENIDSSNEMLTAIIEDELPMGYELIAELRELADALVNDIIPSLTEMITMNE